MLVALANFSGNEEGLCFPCVQTLCDYTCLDRKTVLECLADLSTGGWIEDTGERKGITKQIKVFKLKLSQNWNHPENGMVPILREKSPVFPVEESQKRDTEPVLNRTWNLRESEMPIVRKPTGIGRRPNTVEEAIARASMIGMQEQDARDWYRDCDACGWLRGDGTPFDNWVRQMCIHRDKLAERRSKDRHSAPADSAKAKSVYELAKIIELKEDRCKNLKCKAYNEGNLGGTWTNEKMRLEYVQIRQEIKALKEQIEKRA